MEDEFICIDDLQGHLDTKSEHPLTGAFYGVSYLHFPLSKLLSLLNMLYNISISLERFMHRIKHAIDW